MANAEPAYFEVVSPEIARIGLRPGSSALIQNSTVSVTAGNNKRFDYLVLRDASILEGLAAPYDEEDTVQVTLVERLVDQELFDFWQAHANKDLVTGREFDAKTLAPPKPG